MTDSVIYQIRYSNIDITMVLQSQSLKVKIFPLCKFSVVVSLMFVDKDVEEVDLMLPPDVDFC